MTSCRLRTAAEAEARPELWPFPVRDPPKRRFLKPEPGVRIAVTRSSSCACTRAACSDEPSRFSDLAAVDGGTALRMRETNPHRH
jgi:hypothetical protein